MLICGQLYSSPHAVFRLMRASKQLHVELRRKTGWWDAFYAQVMRYQASLPQSKCLQRIRAAEAVLGHDKQRLLRFVFGRECALCGARFGHRMIPLMGLRACPTPCFREQLVSNITLHARYGVHFSDWASQVPEQRWLVFHTEQLWCFGGRLLTQLTVDPHDYQHLDRQTINYRGLVCFFLRHDVERIVRLDEDEQLQRRHAAQLLTARAARAALQRWRGGGLAQTRRVVLARAQRGARYRELPSPFWIPGGPHLSVLASHRGRDDASLLQLARRTEAVGVYELMSAAWRRSFRSARHPRRTSLVSFVC
jgi:hypothetical protein